MRKFLFDVDGTLTPSRKFMDEDFKDFFYNLCSLNQVYIVTGSDREKTLEQLGSDLVEKVQLLFNCSGNEVWQDGKLVYKSDWTLPNDVEKFLREQLEKSSFTIRTGNHIEHRNGSVNFSIVGRNCDETQRQEYILWDKKHDERYRLAKLINDKYSDVSAFVGGETGIDIFERGKDKQQVVEKIREEDDVLYFFGDQIFENGNDYNIAMECDHYYKVKNWRETYEILSYFSDIGIVE